MNNTYFLYVWCEDITGQHAMITGKAYYDEDTVLNNARKWVSMCGYHASVICNGKEVYRA